MEEEKRKIYYQTKIQIQLPKNSAWHFWKFLMPDGRWRYLRGIKNIKEMRDLLIKYNPQAFYYSTSEFLSTNNVEKCNYQIADQLFLDNKYLVIDIDNLYGHKQVKQSALEVIDRMSNFSDIYKFEGIIFTGRGMRLEFLDLQERPVMLPHEREKWVKETRKQFMLLNLSDVRGVDDIIAWDTRRVIKGIGSPNPHNDFVTDYITSPVHIPAIPGKVNETTGGSPSLRELEKSPDRGLGYSPNFPLYFGRFIRNKVEGTKDRFVPFFSYYKKYKHWEKDLKFLQQKYGLSTIYVMDDHMKVMAFSLDAIPKERLDKIYRNSRSLVKNLWKKFHNIYIRTSSYFNQDLKKIKEYELRPLFKMDSVTEKLHPVSKPHIDFVNYLGFDAEIPDRVIIGNKKNKVYESFFQNRRFDDDK